MGYALVIAFLLVQITCEVRSEQRYERHKLIRVHPQNTGEIYAMKRIQDVFRNSEFEFWKEPRKENQPIDIMVSPDASSHLTQFLKVAEIKHDIVITDIQALIDTQREKRSQQEDVEDVEEQEDGGVNIEGDQQVPSKQSFNYEKYHTFEEILDWIFELDQQYEDLVEVIHIATSYENRRIYGLKISGARKDEDKPSIYMQGGFHAREWIAPATVLVMVNQLLSNYGSDEAITVLIDNIDWYVLPLANVDGYVYTWTEDRFWRKTRSVNENQDCNGTDPNRNWDYDWGGAGTSDIACSPIYGGSSPFSEREVREVAGFITKHNFDAFLDFHAYGQIWMAPWSYSLSSTPDYAEQMEVLKLAIEAVNATNGMEYISGQISHIFSPTSGSSGDWAYGTAHIKYTYGIELRDVWYGDYGFLLPEDQILATGLETFAGVKAIASYILEHATDSDNSTL